jgi:hypothetical protein
MTYQEIVPFQLKQAATWASFDKFKLEGASALERVQEGSVGALMTKTGQYRIMTESDYQTLIGLASEVQRMKAGVNAIVATATVVRHHPTDPHALEALMEVVVAFGDLPRLPSDTRATKVNFPINEMDTDEDAILDSSELKAAQRALQEAR